MTSEENNETSPGHETTRLVDEVGSLSLNSPNPVSDLQYQNTRNIHEPQLIGSASTNSTSSSAQEVDGLGLDPPTPEASGLDLSVQPPPAPCRPLFKSREGRIAMYRRLINENRFPEQRANFEALIKYFEDGGKVPEGKEEIWAFDGQASFGIRFYTHINQMPEGWLYKTRWCDVRSMLKSSLCPY